MTDGIDVPAWTLFIPGALFVLAAGIAIAGRNRSGLGSLSSWTVAAGGVVTVTLGVNALLQESVSRSSGWSPAPFLEATFILDPLRAWFLLLLGLPAIGVGIFALDYLNPGGADPHHGPARHWTDATVAAFLASMSLLVVADSFISFLFFWEMMAVTSLALVIGDGRSAANRRSAYIYGVMTQAGTAFLIVMFLILARNAGSLEFQAMRDNAQSLDVWERTAVFVLALVGFGTKAGLIPVHVWLPRAHPAAPSHGSALMSGVMVKMAILGLVLTLFEFTAAPPLWWGIVLGAAGAISAVLGILYSLMERDVKRLLAYSTVENVGIVTLGVGASLVLTSEDMTGLGALALAATLFHSVNHALFKSLLFLVSGAVQRATGSRDLERLGGLIRGMPKTAAAALVGAAAMAALPLLNGFASEWMLYQSIFGLGWSTDSGALGSSAAIASAALALTSGLALVTAVRLFGMSFLAQSRTDAARDAIEAPRSMLMGMGILAAFCILLGILPMAAVRLLRPVTAMLTGSEPSPSLTWSGALDADRAAGNYVPVLVLLLLAGAGVAPWLLVRWRAGRVTERVSPTWVCGSDLQPSMQYTATAFAKPLRLIFHAVLRPERQVVVERGESPYVISSIHYEEQLKPVYERFVYEPLVGVTLGSAKHLRRLQSGSLRLYLLFFFATLVIAIVMAR